jgi:proline iminopeptidase
MKFIFYLIALSCCFTNTIGQTIQTSDSVSLYLKVAGTGTPCIFVHGGPGAWSLSFEAMGGNALEKNLTMYYYDQRGSGRSASSTDYSIDRMVEDIENIRISTGADKVYVLAHSFGGVIAQKYAEKYAVHLKGLILLNVTLFLTNSLDAQIGFVNQQLGTQFKVVDSIMPVFFAAKSALNKSGLEYKTLSDNPATVAKLDSIDRSSPRNYSFARQALSMPEYFADFTPGTANVKIPVLVITGTADHNIGPDHYKLFKYPNQQVKIIKGGHVLYYEHNKAFAEAVEKFVK